MRTDPAIERTRAARRQISTSLGDDPARLVAYYLEMQKRFGARLRRGPAERGERTESEAEPDRAADAQKDARG